MESKELLELAKAAKDGKIELVIRNGEAEKFLDPIKPIEKIELVITGSIGTISEFLKKRHHLFNPENCRVLIEQNCMTFFGNECQDNNELSTFVGSKLKISKDLEKLNINSGSEFESKDLARFLRQRKNLFVDSEQFKTIWGALSQFKAAIDKKVESADDRSGNLRASIQQEVVHNIPKTFQLSMKVFENAPKIKFEVEIDVNPHDLSCSLMSFDVDEKIEEQRDALINNELQQEIKEGVILNDFCVVYYC